MSMNQFQLKRLLLLCSVEFKLLLVSPVYEQRFQDPSPSASAVPGVPLLLGTESPASSQREGEHYGFGLWNKLRNPLT